MRKPRHGFTIAIGMGPQFAHEEPPDLEQNNDAEETLLSKIFSKLREGDERAAYATLGLAEALQHMASAALQDDDKALLKWTTDAADMVDELEGRSDDNGER
jgi:hypothetical protein